MYKYSSRVAFLLLLVSSPLQADTFTKDFDAAAIKSLELRNGSGKVNIVGSSNAKAKVSVDKVKADKECMITIEQKASALLVVAQLESSRADAHCQVNFDIELPKAVDLNVSVGSGQVKIKDTKGEFRYATGSGDIDFDGEATKVEGRAGSASVTIKGMAGSGDFRSGSGDIALSYLQAPGANTIDIKSGSGSSTISLPGSSKVKSSLSSGSGVLKNDFEESSEAKLLISAKTGSGDLKLVKTSKN